VFRDLAGVMDLRIVDSEYLSGSAGVGRAPYNVIGRISSLLSVYGEIEIEMKQ
jgi:hypothetical protein